MHGIINLDKPAGISSAAAVNQVKRLLARGTKVGHAGTLDPFATGVLLILVGKATKRCEELMDQPKQYEATVCLGATTPTDDVQSALSPTPDASAPSSEEIAKAVATFVGTIQQRPPAFSAVKVGGQRAYKRARQGKPLELAARPVRVDAIKIVDYCWPNLRLIIDCGRGTYIRAIARDLGESLGVGGHLSQLRRTRVGDFLADQAVSLDRLAGYWYHFIFCNKSSISTSSAVNPASIAGVTFKVW